MKILVIGSKGFIGSHLLERLAQDSSHEVWGCDVATDYEAKRYFLIDASNADFDELFENQRFDTCVNCAGAASVPDSLKHPLRDYYLNTKYVFLILESIRKHSPDTKFINLSSAAVYGNPQQLPITEASKASPLSPYGWHKLQSELICKEFSQNFGLATCSLRIFSAYGPGLKKQLFWDWYQKTLTSSQLQIYGTGNESRDFIYVDDLINAIICVLSNGGMHADVINVANGEELFIRDVIHLFKEKHILPFEYSFTQEARKGDPINWVADITKLKSLGYSQTVSFEKGIENYCKWLKEKE